MSDGWVLDCHLDRENECMVLWIKHDCGRTSSFALPWSFTVHVHGESHRLDELGRALLRPEYQRPYGALGVTRQMRRISHERMEPVEVLAVRVQRPSQVRRVAEMIDGNGSWRYLELFSVDPKITQRFLLELGTHPFGRVRIEDERLIPLDSRTEVDWPLPPLRIMEIHVTCHDTHGKRSSRAPISCITLTDKGRLTHDDDYVDHILIAEAHTCAAHLLSEMHRIVAGIDPDVVITHDGDDIDLPALRRLADDAGMPLRLSRSAHDGTPRSQASVAWSYGRLLRKEAYHALEGRLHIDMGRSFIGKEGGIEGLLELARTSGLPAADLSRLSPGSAISAMQIRQSMEDGVLIPWKKNRPEDMKNGEQIMLADRGGLYLDPVVGVHRNVVELDFASLFPSIIATRNISPETMNCSCCDPSDDDGSRRDGRLPLATARAASEIARRADCDEVRRLIVPELGLHVCTRRHGFLARVVAPIIERRNSLKVKRKVKGDMWDRRQNVLKWILVCCFGYTGYRNARFGRIECHEAICAWSRDILLTTIDEADKEGWDCLHAIVDAVWIVDREGRDASKRRESIERLMNRVDALVGIPLEFENEYDWIAFIPNRTTGVGALTKYFARMNGEWKVRGIELRQHSTCDWIRNLQEEMLEDLASEPFGAGPTIAAQRVEEEIKRLHRGEVPLRELVIGRRVRRETGEHRVVNLTAGALLRARDLGQRTPPGRKVRFAVTGWTRPDPADRIRLQSEVESGTTAISGERGDCEFYTPLAIRAASALLSPFGWNDEMIKGGSSIQTCLEAWI